MALLGPSVPGADVIVSESSGDDAAVYRLPDGSGLVQTLDFFTPLVDDPYDWGRIAAANALSDVYAMGGVPALALNVVGWPVDVLPLEMLAEVLRGGRTVAEAAGIAVVGGHTITTEKEPLYGLVAVGLVDLEQLIRNTEARPGMSLVLTKPIGVGMLTTAGKRGVATQEQTRRRSRDDDDVERRRVPRGRRRGCDRRDRRDRVRSPRPPAQAARGERLRGDGRRQRGPDARRRARSRRARCGRRRHETEPRVAEPHNRMGREHAARAAGAGRCANEWRVSCSPRPTPPC